MIRLSLCIATYNRARFIGAALDSIIEQLDAEVEVVVVDGGSDDDTSSVVGARAAGRDNVRYIREASNSGIDVDYDKAVGHARGDYCWLLADDDHLKPGALKGVLEACRQNYAVVVVNAEVRSADLRELIGVQRLPFREDRIYAASQIDALFADTAYHLTFIGAAVIRRKLWMDRDRKSYYGTEFVHVGVIFQAPLDGPVLVIAGPQVMIRYGNAQWTARAFEIWMRKWPRLSWSFPTVTEQAKRAVVSSEPWRSLQNLILLRAKGAYGRDEYNHLLRPVAFGLSALWASLISRLPGSLLNLACVALVRLLSPASKGTLLDLYASRYWVGNMRGKP